MGLALFPDDDYEEVATKLYEPLMDWGCWDEDWEVPTSGGITQARQRLGFEPLRRVFEQVAKPVAEPLTRGAWLRDWRLMSMDGSPVPERHGYFRATSRTYQPSAAETTASAVM